MESGPRLRGTAGLFAAAMGLALAAYFVPAGTTLAQGMAVPGDVSVSETGAASYTIPIAIPPGTAGMTPSLSLSYNSHGGNGLLGMGWQLEGLAAIGRCPRTLAQDGVRGSINYDANDRFCLDGQRLVAISGTYGADGAEYRTEIESFTKVISRGTAGTGPAWFEVWTKSGQRMEFGNSADSRILAQGKPSARTWAVSKVADTKGNYYAVSYVNDAANGEAYPSRVDYTGNAAAGLSPYNSVRFVYETRPDATTAWHVGSMMRSSVRMTKLQTYAGAALVSEYRPAYAISASTGRSQLTSFTICDAAGACLPATSFTWQNGTMGFSVVNNVGGQDGQLAAYRPYVADFNGDGLADVFWDSSARTTDSMSSGNHVLWTNTENANFQVTGNWLGQDGTTISQLDSTCNGLSSVYWPTVADFNRDGRADVFWYNETCGHKNRPEAHLSNTKLWLSNANNGHTIVNGPQKANRRGGDDSYYSYDLRLLENNGDGRPDVIWHKGNDSTQFIWTIQPNSTFVESNLVNQIISPDANPLFVSNPIRGDVFQRSSVTDYNGDGKSDILWLKTDTRGINYLSFGNGESVFTQVSGADASVDAYSPNFVDLNGDGQTDILWDRQDNYGRSQGNRILWISRGDGTFTKINNAGGQDGTVSGNLYRPYLADFNGDGLPDILWDAEDDNFTRSKGQRVLWLSRGENQFTVVPNLNGADGTLVDYAPNLADFNGDGKTDILWDRQVEGDSRSQGNRVLWLSDGIVPDLLTSVTDGLGATVSVVYKSMIDAAVYTRDSGAVDPITDIQGAIQVVARVDQPNGIGGIRSVAYAYVGAKAHSDGRGFLGFREIRTTDLATGVLQVKTYRQEYPLTGLVAQETSTRGGITLSSSVNTHVAADLGGSRRQVTLTQSVTTGADLDGTRLPGATTVYQYDGFGNATQITVTNADGFKKITTNTYSNNTGNWLLGRLATAAVVSQAPTVADQAIKVTTPDSFNFADVPDAFVSTAYERSAVISGFSAPLTAAVSGGDARIRKNGTGNWITSLTILPGETLNIRMTASSTLSTVVTATLRIGSGSADWSVTTMALDDTPDLFDFVDVSNATARTVYEASAVVSGINSPLITSVSGGDAQLRKNGAGSWATSVSVIRGDTLNIRMTSSTNGATATTAIVRLGTANVNWNIATGSCTIYVRGTMTFSIPVSLNINYNLIGGGGGGGSNSDEPEGQSGRTANGSFSITAGQSVSVYVGGGGGGGSSYALGGGGGGGGYYGGGGGGLSGSGTIGYSGGGGGGSTALYNNTTSSLIAYASGGNGAHPGGGGGGNAAGRAGSTSCGGDGDCISATSGGWGAGGRGGGGASNGGGIGGNGSTGGRAVAGGGGGGYGSGGGSGGDLDASGEAGGSGGTTGGNGGGGNTRRGGNAGAATLTYGGACFP